MPPRQPTGPAPLETPRDQPTCAASDARWKRLARILLALSLLSLLALACWCAGATGRWQALALPDAADTGPTPLLLPAATSLAKEFFLFFILACFAGAACGPAGNSLSALQVGQRTTLALLFSFFVSVGMRTLLYAAPYAAPSLPAVLLLGVACLWGSWLGVTWISARRMGPWMWQQALLVGLVLCGGLLGFGWLALSVQRLDITSAELSTADRRRLYRICREHDPRDLQPTETSQLTLTEQDCNQLATWALSLLPGAHDARIQLEHTGVQLQLTLELPQLPLLKRYFNLTTTGRVLTHDRGLGFSPRQLALGRITIPHWLLELSGPLMLDNAWLHRATQPFLQSLHKITVRDAEVQIAYGQLDLQELSVRQTLVTLGLLENLETATRAQIEGLLALAAEQPALRFTECVATAFDQAQQRSRQGAAVHENRAAILALGYLLGHHKLGVFAGANLPPVSWQAKMALRRVTLRGRRDWTRHFLVSAALQVLSNTLASRDAGLLKEELDADGGSGFSFGDLLADRAGTMFAVRSTATEEAAVAMQNRLATECSVDDLMPFGADLPENLPEATLQNRYGGVGGTGYMQLLREIDRRIAACHAQDHEDH